MHLLSHVQQQQVQGGFSLAITTIAVGNLITAGCTVTIMYLKSMLIHKTPVIPAENSNKPNIIKKQVLYAWPE